MPLQTFRYAVSGSVNTFIGLASFYITYHYILQEKDVNLTYYALESYTATLIVSFIISFFVGFFLMKYVVFDDSRMRGRVQLFRYLLVCVFNLTLNYILLKIGVEVLHIYPTLAQVATTAVVIVASYLAQRYFSFKKHVVPTYIEEEE